MSGRLDGTVALVTGASSGIGAATARVLAGHGASVAVVARRHDRLEQLVDEIERTGGTATAISADVTDRRQAEMAVTAAVDRWGRLDIVINNAGVMLIGPVVGAEVDEWERMVQLNTLGLLYVTNAALPHLLAAAESAPRGVADVINLGSVAGRKARALNGVYAMTKLGLGGFTESLRQEVARRHVRVGLVEPGAVATELPSHNQPEIRETFLKPLFEEIETLVADDVAEAIAFMVTRPRHAAVNDLLIAPTEQV